MEPTREEVTAMCGEEAVEARMLGSRACVKKKGP